METQHSVFSQIADESINTTVQQASTQADASDMPSSMDDKNAQSPKESPDADDEITPRVKLKYPQSISAKGGSPTRRKDFGPLNPLPSGIMWTENPNHQRAMSFSTWASELAYTRQQTIAILMSAGWLHIAMQSAQSAGQESKSSLMVALSRHKCSHHTNQLAT